MNVRSPRIGWRHPRLPLATGRRTASAAAIGNALRSGGIAEAVAAPTPAEDALGLLTLAAEVEHALMVQYLYAAASIAPTGAGTAVRRIVTSVAVQEMFHLLAVQNLLLALGGPTRLHVGRDAVRAQAELNPMPFMLEPLSKTALAKFILAEMPADVTDPALASKVAELMRIAKDEACVAPHRVGTIYASLLWIFQADDTPRPPLNLSTDDGYKAGWHLRPQDLKPIALIQAHEARRLEWRATSPKFLLEPVADAETGWALLSTISEQGEGLGEAHDSHFFELIEVLDAFEAGKIEIRPLPRTPFAQIDPPLDAKHRTKIEHEYTFLWARLFDVRYNLLVLDLLHALSSSRETEHRPPLIDLAFINMKPLLTLLTEHLVRQPLRASDVLRAGPTFGLMPPAGDANPAALWQRHRALLDVQAGLTSAIRSHSDHATDASGPDCLEEIALSDEERVALLDSVTQER
jgi:hypothetical protein